MEPTPSKNQFVRVAAISALLVLLVFALTGCSIPRPSQHHQSSSVLQFLYPDENQPYVAPQTPTLRLPLRVGRYEGARRATLGAPLIEFAGEGRICAQVEGSFEVFEIERDGAGEIVRAAVDFQQRCEGSSGGLVGALRFNSNRPLPGSAQPASR